MSGEVRNGTMAALIAAVLMNNSAARFCVLPGLMVPILSLPGLARAAAITSLTECSGEPPASQQAGRKKRRWKSRRNP